MKRKFFYGAILCAAAIVSIFYACKKTEESSPAANPAQKKMVSPTQNAQRTAGTVVYYSKNAGDTVYKMELVTNGTGIVDIERTIYNTTRPDTIRTRIIAGEDVSWTGYNRQHGDTMTVTVPANKTYYLIPFRPGRDPEQVETRTSCCCYCSCGNTEQCDYCLANGPEDETIECVGICDYCYAESTAFVDPSNPNVWVPSAHVGGFVVIEANGLNVIH